MIIFHQKKRSVISKPAVTHERSISTQLNYAKARGRRVEAHEDPAKCDRINQRIVRGIVYSILLSIPFWLIIIILVVWLV